jgi:2-polyprenyl-6-methoxyphenol hydroxylase-like FAD-dependent oxidoreductase
MTTTTSTDVLVAGAGPAGLVLACELLRRGISCRVIDRAHAYPASTRGHALQPRTLEVFDLMGIAPQILATGTTSLITNFYADGKLILELDMGITPRPDAPYLNALVTRQPRIEAVLRDHLHDLGGTIELGHLLSALQQDQDGVTATISDPSGHEIERVRASYLAGCDGGHSTARGLLGLTFDGQTAAEHFALFDAELDWDLDPSPDLAHWFLHDQGMLMAGTFGQAPTWNVFAQLSPGADGQVEPATPDLLAWLVAERTGQAACA